MSVHDSEPRPYRRRVRLDLVLEVRAGTSDAEIIEALQKVMPHLLGKRKMWALHRCRVVGEVQR